MLTIDGSMGEGGGQILRSALALSACLGQAFRIVNIRPRRARPGLQPQHLAAVRAAATISGADVHGAAIGAQALSFTPGAIRAGDYHFDIGTAGSTALVLQTVLPALSLAAGASRLLLEGGTHNPMAPPFEFLHYAFVPALNRMGPCVTARLERPGFYPAGGGRLSVEIEPSGRLLPLVLAERGAVHARHAEVLLAHLPEHIARREQAILKLELRYPEQDLRVRMDDRSASPGNAVSVVIESEHVTECFSAIGARGVRAEHVAREAAREARFYLHAGVPVGHHLADQLLVPLALAGGGSFITTEPSRHTMTNLEVIKAFMQIEPVVEQLGVHQWRISLAQRAVPVGGEPGARS